MCSNKSIALSSHHFSSLTPFELIVLPPRSSVQAPNMSSHANNNNNSDKRSHDYIVGCILESIARKFVDQHMWINTFELYKQYNFTSDIAAHTAQIFGLDEPLLSLDLLKSVYLAQDAANHFAKIYDTPANTCAVDYAVSGDIIWSGLTLNIMSKRYHLLKGM
jgi:hypothetical protein